MRAATRAELYSSIMHSEIIDGPFDDLDIKADSETAGVKLVHPFSRDPANLFSMSLTGEWWRSKTYLLGSGFSFVEGPDDGVAKATVVRAGADWSTRSARSVFAASMHVSVGLDVLDSTQAQGNAPDGNFVSTRLRAQWARRVDFLDSQFISRFDGQFANRALLGMEQMTLGGRWSIRGYRENTLIRDNGLIGSLEWRVPIFVEAAGRVVLEVGPFVDLSYSWNTNRGEIGPNELNSAGLGLNWRPLDRVHFEVYWGHEFDHIDYPGKGRTAGRRRARGSRGEYAMNALTRRSFYLIALLSALSSNADVATSIIRDGTVGNPDTTSAAGPRRRGCRRDRARVWVITRAAA